MGTVDDACERKIASRITIERSAGCDRAPLLRGRPLRIAIKPPRWPPSASPGLRRATPGVIAGAQVVEVMLHPQDSFRRNGVFDPVGLGASNIGQIGFRCKTGIPAIPPPKKPAGVYSPSATDGSKSSFLAIEVLAGVESGQSRDCALRHPEVLGAVLDPDAVQATGQRGGNGRTRTHERIEDDALA
jgi:hypothetical protein